MVIFKKMRPNFSVEIYDLEKWYNKVAFSKKEENVKTNGSEIQPCTYSMSLLVLKAAFFSESVLRFSNLQTSKKEYSKNYPEFEIQIE